MIIYLKINLKEEESNNKFFLQEKKACIYMNIIKTIIYF